MFHISSDKRALESATQLQNALYELVKQQPFDTVSVSLLCAKAGVSRTTFYRLFDTTVDIIHWYCDCQSKKLCRALVDSGFGKEQMEAEWPFRFNLRYILQHPEALELACLANRVDIADSAFYRNIAPFLEPMHRSVNVSEEDARLGGLLVSAIITSAYRAWIEAGKKESADEVYERILRALRHLK